MRIVLAAIDHCLADAWEASCGGLPGAAVHRGSILDVDCDAVVSPANSFGFMDGGIDAVYMRFFGEGIQQVVQQAIRTHHFGELPVGVAHVVETGHPRIAYLIAAPTMRVPMLLRESVNPFLAVRAALLLIAQGAFTQGSRCGQPIRDAIRTVAFPGMGTGVGQVPPRICAHQMRTAIEQVSLGRRQEPLSWQQAIQQHRTLLTGPA